MITAQARAMTSPTTPFSTVTIERRDVGPADEDKDDDAERADIGLPHDLQRAGRGGAAAEAVGRVGQPVQVQAPGQERKQRDGEHGAEQVRVRRPFADGRGRQCGRRADEGTHGRQPEQRAGPFPGL